MTDHKLMQQALNVLTVLGTNYAISAKHWPQTDAAINALRDRLTQPEPGPVAWELREGKTDRVLIEITNNPERAHDWKANLNEVVPLYAAPRQWVGLTKEEAKEISLANRPYVIDMIAALEARLKEKNR